MKFDRKGLKLTLVLVALSLYFIVLLSFRGNAAPTGADISSPVIDYGPTSLADGHLSPGGTITTVSLDAIQQDAGWKAYVGNVSGKLVLRNAGGASIYEWALASSALSGNIFVSRNDSVNWSLIKCANVTFVEAEDAALGISSSAADSINMTFNYTDHDSMVISGIGTIAEDSCFGTATYVNGSAQVVNDNSVFQEILLQDDLNLIYATFINQDVFGFDNQSRDFQLIVGENKTDVTGHTYYFYADIS